MQDYVIRETIALKMAKFSVKPFKDGGDDGTGFKKYGMVIHDNTCHRSTPLCRVDGRIKTYTTGLNEDAPEVQDLPIEKREAKIKAIRQLVARAEREIAGNYNINPEDPNIEKDNSFWIKVTTFKSVVPDIFDNKGIRQLTYWDTLELKLENKGLIFDENNIKDLVMMSVIEAGGFPMVAASYKEALENPRSAQIKFYYDRKSNTAEVKTSEKRVRDEAGAKLLALYEKDSNKLFYITKLLSTQSGYIKTGKNATPLDIMYDECSSYIDALVPEVNSKEEGSKKFLEFYKMKLDELIARTCIKDGLIYGKLMYKEGNLTHTFNHTILGKNAEDGVLYMLSPANDKFFEELKQALTFEWSK